MRSDIVSFHHSCCNRTYLELRVVWNGRLAIVARNCDFPYTKLVLGHGRRIAVPVVEVTDEVGTKSIWSPLAVHNIAVGKHVEAVLFVAL